MGKRERAIPVDLRLKPLILRPFILNRRHLTQPLMHRHLVLRLQPAEEISGRIGILGRDALGKADAFVVDGWLEGEVAVF